jgi:hypothetical protein
MKMVHTPYYWLASALVALVAAATLSGCLVSATESFSEAIGDFSVSANAFDLENVDLREDSTFEEHQEDIELVDRVGFSMSLVNRSEVPAQVSVYISDDPNLATSAEVETKATLIFEDLEVPAAGRTIAYEESVGLLQNFEELQAAVERGVFTVYAVAGGDYSVDINDVIVTITITFSENVDDL